MKHYDESPEAIEWMTNHANALIGRGMEQERALDEAITAWGRSLERLRAKGRFEQALRAQGKPTLHVSLFEAAKLR